MTIIYKQLGFPLFQNKTYATRDEATHIKLGNVELIQDPATGLVYNHLFIPELLVYDDDYQNEQANSNVFQQHLETVLNMVQRYSAQSETGVEIGCGKAIFLEKLRQAGMTVYGFDPAYQGTADYVKKEYYTGSDKNSICADYILLRHVMEHIKDPFSFIKMLASSCKPGCKIYIESPCFDWIIKHTAFYDIFYEHCNYFTLDVLNASFGKVFESGRFFGGQYLYVIADLSTFHYPNGALLRKYSELDMNTEIALFIQKVKKYASIFLWGAGAKGATFCNLLVKNNVYPEAVVDINPKKQNRYIGLAGVPVISPEFCVEKLSERNHESGGAVVLVMNPNYFAEIKNCIKNCEVDCIDITRMIEA